MKEYLGDSVYAEKLDYGIKVYLDNGMGEHTVIIMEPDVVDRFINFAKKCKEES